MKKKWFKVFGIFFFFKGLALIFLLYKGITGFVTGVGLSIETTSIIGLVLIAVGMVMFMAGRGEPRALELTANDKQIIKNAFRAGWKNSPDKRQRKVLKKYGLGYVVLKGAGHGKIYDQENEKDYIRTSLSPSGPRTSKNIATDIINLLEGQY